MIHTDIPALAGIASRWAACQANWRVVLEAQQSRFRIGKKAVQNIRITIMINPPPKSFQNSGSYHDLLKRMTHQVQQNKVDDQIITILQQVFEKELGKENIVL